MCHFHLLWSDILNSSILLLTHPRTLILLLTHPLHPYYAKSLPLYHHSYSCKRHRSNKPLVMNYCNLLCLDTLQYSIIFYDRITHWAPRSWICHLDICYPWQIFVCISCHQCPHLCYDLCKISCYPDVYEIQKLNHNKEDNHQRSQFPFATQIERYQT